MYSAFLSLAVSLQKQNFSYMSRPDKFGQNAFCIPDGTIEENRLHFCTVPLHYARYSSRHSPPSMISRAAASPT